MELLKWAYEKDGRYIIEDDYDSEFRYKGKPIPALQGYDAEDKVIYLGTFSKSIAPAIRLSYMVLPKDILKAYRKKGSFVNSTVSKVDQMIVQHFIEEGYYERHLNKTRALYKNRHDVLIEALKPARVDEAGSAWELDMVDKDLLRRAVLQRPAGQECVLTAHAAPQWMLDAADYVTEMKCIRHPYQKGIAARKGVEY